MSKIKIIVTHEVPSDPDRCIYDGDFWGNEMCKYHAYRDRTHGRKAPAERHIPKCTLFNVWLKGDSKCEERKIACKRAQN